MEDVLDVYARPYDSKRPVVCVDECSKELRSTPRGDLPIEPEQPRREDYEYARHGTANLFLSVEPLIGRRRVRVTERRTSVDFAEELRILVDLDYPDAEQIVLVTDNLNTHTPACLYEAFPPSEARRVASRIEWHYTPEHGSWLNMAETELSVLSRQCLSRRIHDTETLDREIAAWQEERNASVAKIHWQFTTVDARIKLRRLYPQLK
jgi:transposase